VALASTTAHRQSEGPSGTKTLDPRQDAEFDDIETQNDFLAAIWDMSDESGVHIGLSTAQSSVSNTCPETREISHNWNSAPPRNLDAEMSSLDRPDPITKFEWLSHYSIAKGLSNKFNHTNGILTSGQVEGYDTISLGLSSFEETFFGPQYESRRHSNLAGAHISGREWTESLDCETSSIEPFNQLQWYSDPLVLKTNEIVSRIKEAVQKKPRNSIITFDWSPLLEGMCVSFFSPPNIRRLIDTFWAGWYPHWPVIHRPSFDPSITPVTLLASMMLIGACTSIHDDDHTKAKVWGNSVEEMVFSDEYFCSNIIVPTEQSHTARRRLRALQAAHAICLYQYYEGDDVSKRRVRTYRYGAEVVVSWTLISFRFKSDVFQMARELGFSSAKHDDLESLLESTFSWQSFIVKEEMIR
jgi:hypothetical protein